jgi:hypothetical protein
VSRIHAAHGPEALRALEHTIGWRGGWVPVYRYRGERPTARMLWHHAGMPGSAVGLERAVRLSDEHSDEILIGLPQARRWNEGVAGATVLWARIEGSDQLKRARSFRPLPSIVVQEGASSRRWLIWALSEWADYRDLQDANRRVAYNLGAVQKYGDPDGFLVPAPGTCLRVGRSRPVPVVCGRLSPATYTLKQVAGRLKEPPAKDAWFAAR